MKQPSLFADDELPPPRPGPADKPEQKPEPEPTEAEWRTLVATAMQFRELKCWEWVYDSDLFGVKDPETGVTGYCCIMGNLGQVLAMLVYLGTNGLGGYFRLVDATAAERRELTFIYSTHDCLRLEFGNKSDLRPEEKQTFRELGLEFSGRRQWPSFSRMRPGCIPWTISGAEARFLTSCLEQAMVVAGELKANPKWLDPPREGVFLVRQRAADGTWGSEWQEPAPPVPESIQMMRREFWSEVKACDFPRAGAWECDLFYPGQVIHEKKTEQPYFARSALVVDQESGIVLSIELGRPADGFVSVQKALFEAMRRIEAVPSVVCYANDDIQFALADAGEVLGFPLTRVKKLAKLGVVRRKLSSMP